MVTAAIAQAVQKRKKRDYRFRKFFAELL